MAVVITVPQRNRYVLQTACHLKINFPVMHGGIGDWNAELRCYYDRLLCAIYGISCQICVEFACRVMWTCD
jgi:hypothetical protein